MKAYQADLFDGRRKRRNRAVAAKESQEQEALFQWAWLATNRHAELTLLHHIPNGGGRTPWEGRALKRRGVMPGVPDICLPVPRSGYGALYIELKREGGKATETQISMIEALRAYGNRVEICHGWEEARDVLLEYLKSGRSTCA